MIYDGETACLFDLGSGSLANMREHLDYDIIDHIVISHMHADHFFDLVPLRYALLYGPRKRESKVEVWLPPGGEEMLRALVSSFADEGAGDFLNTVFDIKAYDPAGELKFGRAKITFAPTRHYIPTFSLR
ncbi:MAG: MBL fold metallo-hydrolase, partial [Candidatus Eremiobacteraeota bacterium]|nr:MBL fold metallo-hydrolase [Candidatus Eremiobacteraeota bacterium]